MTNNITNILYYNYTVAKNLTIKRVSTSIYIHKKYMIVFSFLINCFLFLFILLQKNCYDHLNALNIG
jgi:hypothetical protein